jgi:hypothetical protein
MSDEVEQGNAVEGVDAGDADMATTVDEAAVEKIVNPDKSPQPEGTEGDPIGDAEDHIASLDMAEERKKAAALMKDM